MDDCINSNVVKYVHSLKVYDEKMITKFKNYLYVIMEENLNNNLEEVRKLLINVTDNFIKSEIETQKRILSLDYAFMRLQKLSLEIYEETKKFVEHKTISKKFQYNDIAKRFGNLLDEVDESSLDESKFLVSEAMLDLETLENSNYDITSLRIGRLLIFNSDLIVD